MIIALAEINIFCIMISVQDKDLQYWLKLTYFSFFVKVHNLGTVKQFTRLHSNIIKCTQILDVLNF